MNSMPAQGADRGEQICRVTPPKVHHSYWSMLLPLWLVATLLTLAFAGAGPSARGETSSTLIIPGKAIGAVHLGMPVRQVSAILGVAAQGQGGQLRFPRWKIAVGFVQGAASEVWTGSGAFRTQYGVGVGATRAEVSRAVGDLNNVVTPTNDAVKVYYPLQGIGFVFRGDRAVGVFVKPPDLGPSSTLGTSQPIAASQTPLAPSMGTITPSTATSRSVSAHAVSNPTPMAAVSSVSVDANGNLVVNGQPFLVIQATNMDYMGWAGAGYTEAQADAKLKQMTQNGYNTLYGNWGTMGGFWSSTANDTLYQDVAAWQRHGLYWHGSGTLDDLGDGNAVRYWLPDDDADFVKIVNRFKDRPNLLLWWISGEYGDNPTGAEGTEQIYCQGAPKMRAMDPRRLLGEHVDDMSTAAWIDVAKCLPVIWVEETMGYQSGETLGHMYDALSALNEAWDKGARFVLGYSTTPISEIDAPADVAAARLPSAPELHRYFMYQVARNARAFDVLWGANQRGDGVPRGDNLPQSFLNVWNWTGGEINKIKALGSVIVAPGRWQPVPTNPRFVVGVGITNNSMDGVFAAKKTFGGLTYVIACNMSTTQDISDNWKENAIPKATIDVGFPIGSADRLFEAGAVSFSGSAITDAFIPTGTHIYAVRPRP